MEKLSVGILIIGDEILKGQVADSNSYFMCKELYSLGIKVGKISVLPDSVEDIASEIKEFSEKFTYVITTGGVGLTHDDLTYEGVGKAFNFELELNKKMTDYYKSYCGGVTTDLKTNPQLRISYIPKMSEVIFVSTKDDNFFKSWGSYPIIKVLNVFIFPGPPKLAKLCFKQISKLYFQNSNTRFFNRIIYVNRDEISIVQSLNQAVKEFKDFVVFGSYPVMNNSVYQTKLTLEATSMNEVDKAESFLTSLLPSEDLIDPVVATACDDLYQLITSESSVIKNVHFVDVLRKSILVVEEALNKYTKESLFINFNGGKDCTVLLHLVTGVWQHKFKENPSIHLVYFRNHDPFPEVELFIQETSKRYKFQVTTVRGPIKTGLSSLLEQHPEWKGGFMGTRRTDPFSEDLHSFQMTDEDWPPLMRINPLLDWNYNYIWTYLLTLRVPYCSLYDQGAESIMNQLEMAASFIESPLTDAFGSEGLALFVQKCNGSISITRSGFEILNILIQDDVSNPLSRYLLNFIHKINSTVGDGIKTFIFYVNAFVKLLNRGSDVHFRLKQLKKFQSVVNSAEANHILKNKRIFFNKNKLDSFIKGFFLSRFAVPVSDIIFQLVANWIHSFHARTDCDFINLDILKMLLDNVNILCLIKSEHLPINESKMRSGLIVKGKINGFHVNFQHFRCVLKVFLFPEDLDCELKYPDCIESDIIRLISETKFQNDETQVLLVTNVTLSDSVLFYLRIKHIVSFEGVLIENVKFLNDFLLQNYLTEEFITDFMCENRNSLWISIPGTTQLLLCSPTKDLGIQLRDSLINLLTVLKYSLIAKNLIFDKNGNFELLFYLSILNTQKKYICFNPSIFVNNRNELRQWKKIIGLKDSFMSCNNECGIDDSEHGSDKDVIELTKFVSYLSNCISEQTDLSDDFLALICDVLYYKVRKNKLKDNEFYCYDLVSVKLAVLSYAIDFILSIHNIDTVMHTKREF